MENPAPVVYTCKSCHNQFTGLYCNVCGEKVIIPADRSFKSFINSIIKAITFADNKFANTMWLMLSKPGFVSFEVVNGRTVKYLNPLSVFFVLNLAYFFFPDIQLFSASLRTQMLGPLSGFYTEFIARKMVKLGMDFDSFSFVYNMKTTGLAKLMVMVFVVVASLPLNLLYRKRNRYFTDHVGYAVELACFNLFLNAIVLNLAISWLHVGKYFSEAWLTAIFVASNLYFLLRSGYIFYHEKSWKLVLKSFIMIAFLKIALEAYRVILFFVTMVSL